MNMSKNGAKKQSSHPSHPSRPPFRSSEPRYEAYGQAPRWSQMHPSQNVCCLTCLRPHPSFFFLGTSGLKSVWSPIRFQSMWAPFSFRKMIVDLHNLALHKHHPAKALYRAGWPHFLAGDFAWDVPGNVSWDVARAHGWAREATGGKKCVEFLVQ